MLLIRLSDLLIANVKRANLQLNMKVHQVVNEPLVSIKQICSSLKCSDDSDMGCTMHIFVIRLFHVPVKADEEFEAIAMFATAEHEADWLGRLDGPWVRPTGRRKALKPGRPAARPAAAKFARAHA
jgi:hypothetical protein